jgi:hypothetical protein
MNLDRRDFFKFVGGSVVGLACTPVPWTLLNDSSKWSQNWSWIPRLQKGEMRVKFTTCTLCPAGCGVKARCVGEQPVHLTGVSAHPSSRGALCPVGLAAHQQPYHPARLRQPLRRGNPVTMDAAVAAVRQAIAGAEVAVWDPNPGRVRSAMYQRFAAGLPHGVYLTSPAPEGGMLRALARMFERPAGELGLDVESARTILSFGAPILDGWGTPGRVLKQRAGFRLVQAEPELSRTATLADTWLAIRPGSETALALAIGHVLTRQNLVDPTVVRSAADYREYLEMTAAYTPENAAAICGIPADKIYETARELAIGGPVVVITESEVEPIAALNFLFGGAGRTIVKRGGLAPLPAKTPEDTGDGSIQVLIAAGNVPWERFEKKLAPEAVVVSLSPWTDRRVEIVIPAPVAVESMLDVPAPFDAGTDMFSLAAPLATPPAGVIDPAEFLARIEPALGTVDAAMETRIKALHQTRRGSVISYLDGSTKQVTEFASPADLQKALLAGSVWVDDPVAQTGFSRFSLTSTGQAKPPAPPKTNLYGWRAVHGLSVSPILSKLYQESGLRDRREA